MLTMRCENPLWFSFTLHVPHNNVSIAIGTGYLATRVRPAHRCDDLEKKGKPRQVDYSIACDGNM